MPGLGVGTGSAGAGTVEAAAGSAGGGKVRGRATAPARGSAPARARARARARAPARARCWRRSRRRARIRVVAEAHHRIVVQRPERGKREIDRSLGAVFTGIPDGHRHVPFLAVDDGEGGHGEVHEAVAGGDGHHRRRRVITRRVIVIALALVVVVVAVSYCRVGCGFHLDLDLDAKAVAGVAEGPVRAFDVELDGIVRHGQRAVPVGHRGSVREEVHDDHELLLGAREPDLAATAAAARPGQLRALREVESHAYLRGVDVTESDDGLGPLRGLLRCEGRDGPALDDVARGVELLHGSKGNFEKITRLVAGVNLELGSLADELDADARVGRRRWGR